MIAHMKHLMCFGHGYQYNKVLLLLTGSCMGSYVDVLERLSRVFISTGRACISFQSLHIYAGS